MRRKWLALLLTVGLMLEAASAAADIILEPMGVFEFAVGIDGNYEEFTTQSKEDCSHGAFYIVCSCGAETHSISTTYEIEEAEGCPYEITLEKTGYTFRNGEMTDDFNIVCTPRVLPVTAGLYPFTIKVKVQCGAYTGWAECTIPLTIRGDAPAREPSYGSSKEEVIFGIDYSADTVYAAGDSCRAVWFIQTALSELRYYEGDLTGHYGSLTQQAVKRFQRAEGLPETGECDAKTMSRLFGAYFGKNETTYEKEFYNPEWFSSKAWFDQLGLKPGADVTLIDLWTDVSMRIRIQAMGNHIDAEPLTAADTRALCRVYGVPEAGEIDYRRRPMLLVVPHEGKNIQIVCSIYAYPHGAYTIFDNDYDGAFCLHLLGSTTHGTNVVDNAPGGHQEMIAKAVELMGKKKDKVGIGDIMQNEDAFENMPPVEVPTLIMPDGTAEDVSKLLKFDEPKKTSGTVTYNVHVSNLEGEEMTLSSECLLYFPYPEGMDETSKNKFHIIIHHYAGNGTTEVFKSEDGDIDFTKQGLCIRVSSLSPFEITWEGIEGDDDPPQAGDNNLSQAGNADLPQTGDASLPMSFLLLAMATSLCCLGLLAKKRYS